MCCAAMQARAHVRRRRVGDLVHAAAANLPPPPPTHPPPQVYPLDFATESARLLAQINALAA